MLRPPKSISGFNSKKFLEMGANVRRCIIKTTLSREQWNAAASICPTLLLMLETLSGISSPLKPLNASTMAFPSMGSPTGVPVAWASI